MAAPELAARLSEVHDEMNFAERMDLSDDHDLDWARHLDQRHTMARRRREILAEIRELPGFADFLRPLAVRPCGRPPKRGRSWS